MDLAARHLLQEGLEGSEGSTINGTDPAPGTVTYRGFEFGVFPPLVSATRASGLRMPADPAHTLYV